MSLPFASGQPPVPFSPEDIDEFVMRSYARYPLVVSHGAGSRLYDTTGTEYLDFVAGIATCALGHAHPALVEAVSRQIRLVHHVSNLYVLPQQIELAALLTTHSAGDKVFFCNSGAEANEAAIKLARKHAHVRRGVATPVIISAEGSFHGRTLAALTATAQPKYHKGFGPLVPGFRYVPLNDSDALESSVRSLRPDEGLAAIFLEPVQGEGGVRLATKDFVRLARRLCDEAGALLLFDEVQTGIGRSGTFWAYEQLDVEPDLISSAKGLGGGVPIGALIAKETACVFEPGDHASTYGGNALACAAALAVCRIVVDPAFLAEVRERAFELEEGLRSLVASYPELFSETRGMGLIRGLVIREDIPMVAADLVRVALDERLLVLPAGPKVIRLVPPLTASSEEIADALERLERSAKRELMKTTTGR